MTTSTAIREILGQRLDRGRSSGRGTGGQTLRRCPPGRSVRARRAASSGSAEHVGQIGQDLQVLVGFGGDADHQIDPITRVPLHAVRHLQHRHARVLDQSAVLGHAVRDGDAVAEIGVGHLLAGQQAVHIAGLDEARVDEQLTDLADRLRLIARARAQAYGR